MEDPQSSDSWRILAQPSAVAELLAAELHLSPAIARLLVCRGIKTLDAARSFLAPSFDQLHDPRRMLGMDAAVVRLQSALANAEPVLIYGDYDVDGTVATVLLKTALGRAAGALGKAADIRYHIPHRIREGYGMQQTRIAEAAAEGVRLVISVDTGIRAFAAAEQARAVGVDLIVTDHHLPDALGVPEAIAVVNPNQPGCPYPCKDLCGAAVAFKLAQALLEATAISEADRQRLRTKLLPSFLKLLAIATIADSVALTDENRAIVALGLRELRHPVQPGLRALMELARIDLSRPIAASDIGFRVAPRINAAGRMDIASDVVELFLARDAKLATELAQKLHSLNDDRRATEAEALRAIEAELDALAASEAGLPLCIVLDDGPDDAPDDARKSDGDHEGDSVATRAWHRGVIGILASRVVDRTGRPALVLTHADGLAYGSGRSVEGFHLLDALTCVHQSAAQPDPPLFTRFGGHAHAVGFTLPSARVADLRLRLGAYAVEQAAASAAAGIVPDTANALSCDAELTFAAITPDFLASLEQLGPFGMGNPEPIFITRSARIAAALKIVNDRHLRLNFEDALDGVRFWGMAWARRTDWAALALRQGWQQGHCLDIAYRLHHNTHPDFGGWELDILALRDARADRHTSDPQRGERHP